MDYFRGPKDAERNRSRGYEDFVKTKYDLKVYEKLSREQQTEANILAREATINFLKDEYEEGLTNIAAQTRIASSYGLLQTLYITVLDEHYYPTTYNDRPENLNDVKISMDYAIKHLIKLFDNTNAFNIETNNNWISNYSGKKSKYAKFTKPSAGFEGALTAMYYKWNPGLNDAIYAIYHKKVLNNSRKFLPRSK